LEKETSLPGGGSLRHAVSVETAARTATKGEPMAWDCSHAGKRRSDPRYADAIGGGKSHRSKGAAVVLSAVSCPWLIDALVRADQQRQYLSSI